MERKIVVGGVKMAALCAGCGALCPNTWCERDGYVTDTDSVEVWCCMECYRVATTPQTEANMEPGDREIWDVSCGFW